MTLVCLYLCIDNFIHDTPEVGRVALACGLVTAAGTGIYHFYERKGPRYRALLYFGIFMEACAYWAVFAYFLYTGGTGGTSIFLFFIAGPACFFSYNLVLASGFCFVILAGMTVYMNTPLHLGGYRFPDEYYRRLPVMYLLEIIICAISQYMAVRAKILQDEAIMEAERANAAKTDFLANTSHEIRTPINAVLGMNEMILRESSRAEEMRDTDVEEARRAFRKIKSYAGNVESAGKNLLAIINDILDISKIEEGMMELVEVDYRLSSVLNDVSNMIHFKAKEKDLTFVTDVDETLPDRLRGDEVRVRQVITNILNNAVKYTDAGGVTLKVRGEIPDDMTGSGAGAANGKTVRLIVSVSDTGIGIRQDDLDKLFTKFERIDLKNNSTIEGTGLGLAITRHLLDMMNGSIRVESVYGEGSTFTITLPQTVRSSEPVGDFKSKFEQYSGQRTAYREMFRAPAAHILAVDDTEMNLVVIQELLKQTQVRTDVATDGVQALKMTRNTPYDLILMDYRMPRMDGKETMQNIRLQQDGCNADTTVICLTADAVHGARERYLAEGFDDYLSKPVEILSLEAALMKYLPPEKVIRTNDANPVPYETRTKDAHGAEPVRQETSSPADAETEMTPEEAALFIRERTPELLSSLQEMITGLKSFFDPETDSPPARRSGPEDVTDRPVISPEELEELYEAVREFSRQYDQDGIRNLLKQADGYEMPESERERLDRVRQCARDSDWNALQSLLTLL